jgi:hypothetical protein
VIKLFVTRISEQFEITMLNGWVFTTSVYFLANLLALPLALIVEFPLSVLAKEILERYKMEKIDELEQSKCNEFELKKVEVVKRTLDFFQK